MDSNPAIVDLAAFGGSGFGGSAPRRTRLVLFEFTGASTLAYVPQNPCHIVAVCPSALDIMLGLSTSEFPAAVPSGATSRVLDYLTFSPMGQANVWVYMNKPVEVGGQIATLYAKKFNAGGAFVEVILAFDTVQTDGLVG